MTRTLAKRLWLTATLLAALGQPVALAEPPGPPPSRAEIVRDVLRRHWSVVTGDIRPPPLLIDLEAIGRDPELVQPGAAEASVLFNRLVAQGPVLVTTATGTVRPAAVPTRDLGAVREWLDGLPALAISRCQDVPPLSHPAVAARIADDLAGQLAIRRPKLRYLSLVAMKNRCAAAFPESAAAIRALIARMALAAVEVVPARLDASGALWRLDLDEMKLTAAQWDNFASYDPYQTMAVAGDALTSTQATGTRHAVIRADALAASLFGDAPAAGPLKDLLGFYREPLDADASAAELGMAGDTFRKGLFTAPMQRMQSLLVQPISRARFDDWYPSLAARLLGTQRALPPRDKRPAIHRDRRPLGLTPELQIVTEQTALSSGDLMSFAISSTVDCALEIIDVDPLGRATLLFPNDFQRDGRLKAGTRLELPGATAPYQLRLNRVGAETVIALCYAPGSRRERSYSEYVRQRFLDLGEWRTYQANDPGPPPRGRAATRPAAKAPAAPPRLLARAAFRIEVR